MKNSQYMQFLERKKITHRPSGFEINKSELNAKLFDFQKDIVMTALKNGKFAIFAECGLGKTAMQLEWANQITNKYNKPVIIIAPLSVSYQTIEEGKKFDIEVKKYDYSEVIGKGIYISNYEQLDNINASYFIGVVLDESSILKNFNGAYKQKLITTFSNTDYKLCCTATPSPNDPMELGNHSEFLNYMKREEMLSMFFVHDGGETAKWRLKGHAKNDFWAFVGTWAISLTNPNDLGYCESGFNLPELELFEHCISTEENPNNEGLFNEVAVSAIDFNSELRRTIKNRLDKVIELANSNNENWIIWIKHNAEGDYLKNKIIGAKEVRGSDDDDYKEQTLLDFAKNKFRVLITKTKIASFGMNYQNCNNQIFASLDFSFEGLYQGIRRSYRFKQKNKVNIHIITTDTMLNVIQIIKEKQKQFNQMRQEMLKSNKLNYNEDLNILSEKSEGENWKIWNGDSVQLIKMIEDKSIDFSIFSPPFADLYTYSNKVEDLGNVKNYQEFEEHFGFLIDDLFRIIKDGRNVAVHSMDLPIQKGKEGYIGIRDFSGFLINIFTKAGFIYHSRVTIWKDPVIEMTRTKALGLLHKQLKKDSTMSRVGMPDYLLVFRKPGENLKPVSNINIPVELWQKYASPVWYDIKQGNTLQGTSAREHEDEKHICPLQLDTIERSIILWSNEGDTVFTPFMGIGSEVYQAVKMKRKGIGFELKNSYYTQAKNNLINLELELNSNLFSSEDLF